MSTIAENVVNEIIKTQFQQEIMNKYATIQGLFNFDGEVLTGMCVDNSAAISADLSIFVPTDNIQEYINDFKQEVSDFVIEVDKAYKDGSNFLEALSKLSIDIPCVGNSSILLNALGISSALDISKLKCVPDSFLDWVNTVLLKSILTRINIEFPHLEFSIGINISQIFHNIAGFDLVGLLVSIDELIDCLYVNFGVDMRYIRTGVGAVEGFFSINEILSSLYLDVNGNIDYTLLGLDETSTSAISSIVKTNKIIINDSLNNIAKVTKTFEIPPFIFDVS